jgi:uncharacterized protein YkwD
MAWRALLPFIAATPLHAFDFSRGEWPAGQNNDTSDEISRCASAKCFNKVPFPVNGSNDQLTAERWLKATNIYRCMHGVPYVGWSEEGARAAQSWANQIGPLGEMIHYRQTSGGSYTIWPPYGPAGENIAMGQGSPEEAVEDWYSEVDNCVHLPG